MFSQVPLLFPPHPQGIFPKDGGDKLLSLIPYIQIEKSSE